MPPLDSTWTDQLVPVTLPSDQPTPAAAQPDLTPVIDVGPSHNPMAVPGQPGSELAPTHVSPNAAPAPPNVMPAPSDKNADWTKSLVPVSLPTDTQPSKAGGIIGNIGAGTSNAVAQTLGAPVDLATGAINLGLRGATSVARGLNSIVGAAAPPAEAPQITNPVGGSDWFKQFQGVIGANPDAIQPTNELERMARAGGEGAASMVLPWTGARVLPMLTGYTGAIQRALGAGPASAAAATGLVGGAAGQEAQDSVPTPMKPLAGLAGSVLGGSIPIALRAGAASLGTALGPVVGHYIAPLTTVGQQALAGQRVAGAATDIGTVNERLANPAPPLVVGSQPTTFQATADPGLGTLERVTAKNTPDAFIDRAAQQNQARVQAVRATAKQNASPSAVGQAFRAHLGAIDQLGEAATGAARANAQSATMALGGVVPTGADAQTTALQSYGRRLRSGLDEANQNARSAVSKLYDAVDPDGKLVVDMSGIKQAARDIAKDIPKNAAPLEGDAGAIMGLAQMQPKAQAFREVAALRSRITDAMRTELYDNGRSQTYRRLSQLLAAVDDTLTHGVEAGGEGVGERLAATARKEAGGSVASVGSGSGAEAGGGGAAGPVGVPSAGAENSGTQGGPGAGGGDRAMAPTAPTRVRKPRSVAAEHQAGAPPDDGALVPNFDAEAAARYRAANAAHAERVGTYDEAPGVGQTLAAGKRAGEWRLGDSQVAATIFNSGKGAAERIQAFLKAGGDNADLVSDLKDYASFSLRRAAEDADGTLDPGKTAKWMKAHEEALGAFPDLAKSFETAAAARETMDAVMARHLAAREEFEKSAAAHFLGDADPVARVGKILRSDTADATMRELADLTAKVPAAREGLRRAVVDHVINELSSNSLAGDTTERQLKNDVFQTFMRRALPAMRHIFEPEEIESMQNVAADIQRSQRSVTGTKLPGGSNTAQDIVAGEKLTAGKPSVLGTLIAAEAVGEAAQHAAGPVGRVVGMVAVPVLSAMRQEGLKTVDDLVSEAMLHPELARALLAKIPAARIATPVWKNAGRQILALSGASALRARDIMQGGSL